MRVLVSTIGSRGEAQPALALATQLRELGQEAVVCAPPDFREWAESLGVEYLPVGPRVHGTAKQKAGASITAEQRRAMIEGTVADQFAAVGAAAEGCDVIVGGGALAIAARSVAEHRGIGYVYAAFAPVTLPSPHHAPPVYGMPGRTPADGTTGNGELWAQDAQRWYLLWSAPLNAQREALGLTPVTDVSGHIYSGAPWLAADPTLAPWPEPSELKVLQTGAWILPDHRPLPPELETFLDAGEPPVYFGFGSVRAPEGIARAMIEAVRSLGRRAILARGWAELEPIDDGPDVLAIGEVNQQALFPRVAVVAHHGGAGTTTAAAAAGAAQLVVPQMYDQFSFAGRVERLGIGTAHPADEPTAGSLTAALGRALAPEVAETARTVAGKIRQDGALTAARHLIETRRPGSPARRGEGGGSGRL
ncbi:glycosyl transferase [Sphaerisporangium melleum]|uniref:Glycosyl transferase n=1 Tax=Sphaerisporangium melleum TaxID=321316 RepID=A0A917QVI3_9ACTN|nr:glycosyltransferase [Sphaerisporangium melleum]GGK69606.1 glycosyl transferase [Sphaerisporangium melleum]GII69042.1 glycosyl transferase [Sphaerisporangium melleum]